MEMERVSRSLYHLFYFHDRHNATPETALRVLFCASRIALCPRSPLRCCLSIPVFTHSDSQPEKNSQAKKYCKNGKLWLSLSVGNCRTSTLVVVLFFAFI